jgi:hypothetical protein
VQTTCPCCGGKVHGHGTRERLAIINTVKKWFKVDRFLCTECGKTFTLLPDFLLPFKHYPASEIEAVLIHLFSGGALSKSPSMADIRTLRGWWKEFKIKLAEWAGLLEVIFQSSAQTPGVLDYRHPLKRLEEALSRLPLLPSHWTIMVKTLWWLNPTHPLCLP